jgi:hypothetical protein
MAERRQLEDRHGIDVPSSSTARPSRRRRRNRGQAYHAGKRAQQDEYDEQASEPYEASQSEPAPPEYVARALRRGGEVDELSRLAQMHDSGD